VTSKPDFKVMVLLLLVIMQLTRDLFAIAKFLFINKCGAIGAAASPAPGSVTIDIKSNQVKSNP